MFAQAAETSEGWQASGAERKVNEQQLSSPWESYVVSKPPMQPRAGMPGRVPRVRAQVRRTSCPHMPGCFLTISRRMQRPLSVVSCDKVIWSVV